MRMESGSVATRAHQHTCAACFVCPVLSCTVLIVFLCTCQLCAGELLKLIRDMKRAIAEQRTNPANAAGVVTEVVFWCALCADVGPVFCSVRVNLRRRTAEAHP